MSKAIGDAGEDLACEFLEKNNYKILERNYRKCFGEIDVVAKENNVIVFVEVKYRKNESFGTPAEFVTKSKIEKILKTAKTYLYENDLQELDWRIDVLAINKDKGNLEHIENIYIEGVNY